MNLGRIGEGISPQYKKLEGIPSNKGPIPPNSEDWGNLFFFGKSNRKKIFFNFFLKKKFLKEK